MRRKCSSPLLIDHNLMLRAQTKAQNIFLLLLTRKLDKQQRLAELKSGGEGGGGVKDKDRRVFLCF